MLRLGGTGGAILKTKATPDAPTTILGGSVAAPELSKPAALRVVGLVRPLRSLNVFPIPLRI